MVPSDFIFKISQRLSGVQERPEELFGGVCMILLGDPLQLKPVRARYPWEEPKNQQHRNFNVGGSLWSEFVPIVLRTNHRQGDALEFAKLCEKIREELTNTETADPNQTTRQYAISLTEQEPEIAWITYP